MRAAARVKLDLRSVSLGTVVVIAGCSLAALLYLLLDVLLLVFVGIIVAAALQPRHQVLSRIGVPKAVAVLMIYLAFLGVLGLTGLLVMPVLAEQVSTLVAQTPDQYEAVRAARLHLSPDTAAQVENVAAVSQPIAGATEAAPASSGAVAAEKAGDSLPPKRRRSHLRSRRKGYRSGAGRNQLGDGNTEPSGSAS